MRRMTVSAALAVAVLSGFVLAAPAVAAPTATATTSPLVWSAPAPALPPSDGSQSPPHSGLAGISCPAISFCAAYDSAAAATRVNERWNPPTVLVPPDDNRLDAISCASANFCVALDNKSADGYAQTSGVEVYRGHGWSNHDDAVSANGIDPVFLLGVSCVSKTFCVAVGNGRYDTVDPGSTAAYAVIYDGSTVRTMTLPAPDGANSAALPNAVSCTSRSFCVATGASASYRYDGSGWSLQTGIDSAGPVGAVSCTSPMFCMAADEHGYAVRYDGTSWGQPIDVLKLGQDRYHFTYTAISCADRSCVLVNDTGLAARFNGQVWAAPKSIDPDGDLTAVSCPTATYCVAVDSAGTALTGRAIASS